LKGYDRENSEVGTWKGVMVFTEVQDHERILEGSLELLSCGRKLAERLGGEVSAVLMGLDAEQYLPEVERFGPDKIFCCSHRALKHYDSQIFPDMFTALIREHRPSIVLFPASEAGSDLAPRLAQRFSTGLTAHCTGLEIIDSEEHGQGLLLMKRPAFSGNVTAEIICPHARPQMATVQPGVFRKDEPGAGNESRHIKIDFNYDLSCLRIRSREAPLRWDRHRVPLEQAGVIIAGGRGMCSKSEFEDLYRLSDLVGGEVGATRVPVFNSWCGQERMIGQTGKSIRPVLYAGFGISGQLQHTSSILDSEIIIAVNIDTDAPIFEISDYAVYEDAPRFIRCLIERIEKEHPPGT